MGRPLRGTLVREKSIEVGRGLTRAEFVEQIRTAARQRLMPIFLTTATTVGGLVPLALFGGPLWEGLAWLLIFGLTSATVLILIVIPVLYAFLRAASRT